MARFLHNTSRSYLGFTLLHIILFILAIPVCALYGIDLDRARKAGVYADGKWVYAEVVGGLSALTAAVYCIPFVLRLSHVWIWNLALFILWIALFGVFGSVRSSLSKPHPVSFTSYGFRLTLSLNRCTSMRTPKEMPTSSG